jgi:putative transposase
MPYKTTQSRCVVQLVSLRGLSPAQVAFCAALRAEAGRCWKRLVDTHRAEREQGCWYSVRELEQLVAGQFALHSQTLQALAQKLDANLQTAQELREQEVLTGPVRTKYPYKTPDYQTVPWKDKAIRVLQGQIVLSNGRKRDPLILPLPEEFHISDIRKVELLWRADHYQLALTIDTHKMLPPPCVEGVTAGVDLGEVNVAAVVTEPGQGLDLSGRLLRSYKRLRNKRHAAYTARMDRCKIGSRRWKRLARRKAQASAKLFRQQRNFLHQASRRLVRFCQQQGVNHIAIGDVRDIQDGVELGKHTNQKIAQWPHGQLVQYVADKASQVGIATEQIPEDYSTRTCSACGHLRATAPRGRVYRCTRPGCRARLNRDGNGAANICSRACHAVYAQVHLHHLMYLRPIVVVPRHRP